MGIKYPIPPSAEASKIHNLNELWVVAGLTKIETKKSLLKELLQISRNFGVIH